MAKDGDEKGLDEHTRIGVAPTPKLPGAPAPAAPPPAAPDEHTQVRATPPPPIGPRPAAPSMPPPPVAPAAPTPALGESTRLAVTPPPLPKTPAPPAPPAAQSTVPQQAALPPLPGGGGDFTEHTILLADLQRQVVPAARLQRMQPPGRSDVVTLDRTHYLMGRLPSCDLRLYSQTASREHAQLTARDGRWYLTPVTGKVVLVNGTQVKEEVPLTHKMRLQLGGDELLFLDESRATAVEDAPRAGAGIVGQRWWLAVIGLVALATLLWLWATR